MTMFCLVTPDGEPTDKIADLDAAPALAANKGQWLPYTKVDPPAVDPETHRLWPWEKAVVEGAVVESCRAVALTPAEIEARTIAMIAATDAGLVRAVEDIVALVCQAKELKKANIPPSVIDKVNVRRALRGLDPV